MAYATNHIDIYPKAGVFARLGDWAFRAMARIAENDPRMRQTRALQAMSDADLAARGLRRADIAAFVFRDIYMT